VISGVPGVNPGKPRRNPGNILRTGGCAPIRGHPRGSSMYLGPQTTPGAKNALFCDPPAACQTPGSTPGKRAGAAPFSASANPGKQAAAPCANPPKRQPITGEKRCGK
jgi:hypothetical protein